MLEFGWSELVVIIAVIVLVVGPDDIPKVMVALGRIARRLYYVRYAITQQFDELMREADLEDIRKQVNFEDRASAIDEGFDEVEADEIEAEAMLIEVEQGASEEMPGELPKEDADERG